MSETIDTYNPATGEKLDHYHLMSADDAEQAITRSQEAYLNWRRTSFAARADLLNNLADLMEARVDDLANLKTKEMGKMLRKISRKWKKMKEKEKMFHKRDKIKLHFIGHLQSNKAKKAIEIFPLNIEFHQNLAEIYWQGKMYDQAAEEYEIIIKHDPLNEQALYRTGLAFLKKDMGNLLLFFFYCFGENRDVDRVPLVGEQMGHR